MAGQERHQVGDDADRADARPAATVRMQKVCAG
jgi:hypothetical protein